MATWHPFCRLSLWVSTYTSGIIRRLGTDTIASGEMAELTESLCSSPYGLKEILKPTLQVALGHDAEGDKDHCDNDDPD